MVDQVIPSIPPSPIDRPIERWSFGELLSEAARHGLMRIREFVTKRPITAESDMRAGRLLAQAGQSIAELYVQVHQAQMRRGASEQQEDWAAYQKELEREARALGVLGPSSGAERMREKRAKKDSSQAR